MMPCLPPLCMTVFRPSILYRIHSFDVRGNLSSCGTLCSMEGGLLLPHLLLIEVCDANQACIPELFELEQQFSNLSILETPCMSECEMCQQSAYVLLEGSLINAANVVHLLEDIRCQIAYYGEADSDSSI
ncbi:DUF1450 domain-containing protein [Alicyclobacillaceae bacterium I2511]|nr:DUF1450 domain-containing protein [Alicyclobacillaceae bacterium I2511]